MVAIGWQIYHLDKMYMNLVLEIFEKVPIEISGVKRTLAGNESSSEN